MQKNMIRKEGENKVKNNRANFIFASRNQNRTLHVLLDFLLTLCKQHIFRVLLICSNFKHNFNYIHAPYEKFRPICRQRITKQINKIVSIKICHLSKSFKMNR